LIENNPNIKPTKKKQWLNRFLTLFKLIVTFGLLGYVFYKFVNFKIFLEALTQINILIFLLVLAITFINRVLIAYQTDFCFHKIYKINFGIKFIFKVQQISSFYGLFLPGDLAGGVVTWYYFSSRSGKKTDTAATVVLTRLLIIFTLIITTAIGIFLDKNIVFPGVNYYLLTLIVLAILAIMPFIKHQFADSYRKLTTFIIHNTVPFRKIRLKLDELNQKLWDAILVAAKSGLKTILYTLLLSFFSQVIMILTTYIILKMTGIDLPYFVAIWLLGLVSLVQLLPVSFGGIGVRDFTVVSLLAVFYQIQPEKSVLFSTLLLIYMLFYVLLGGIFSLGIKKSR
jgi:glycosyltransferase 2 family protein